MIGVGIIGAGYFGEKHAEAIAAMANARVVAASRTNTVALEQFVKRYGGRAYADYRDLLADRSVEAVAISTPHHLHTEIAVQAAQARKHILLEKPIALNMAECDQILNAVKQSGVTFMAGHTNHFVPAYCMAKELISSGDMGKLVLAIDRTLKQWQAPNRRDWHLDRRTGGGIWLTIGVHNVDRLIWLVGSKVRSVSAHLSTSFHDQLADDTAIAFLRYDNGVVGTAVAIGYQTGVSAFEMELVCTSGTIRVDKTAGVHVGRGEAWQHVPGSESSDWMGEGLVKEWQAFLKAIESRMEPEISADFVRHVMQVVFAAEESSRCQQEVLIS